MDIPIKFDAGLFAKHCRNNHSAIKNECDAKKCHINDKLQ